MSNNEVCPDGYRLFKIREFCTDLIRNYRKFYTPKKTVCVDESLVPFRGRLAVRQYIPNKASKGVKILKLCSDNGYTWNFKVYAGRERDPQGAVPTMVVMQLADGLLDRGRTIITDNYYSIIDLATRLLGRQTHLLGALRKNRKGNPKEEWTKN